MSPPEISNVLGLSALKNKTWAIFIKISALKGEGLEEAMEWSISTSKICSYQLYDIVPLLFRLVNALKGATS